MIYNVFGLQSCETLGLSIKLKHRDTLLHVTYLDDLRC